MMALYQWIKNIMEYVSLLRTGETDQNDLEMGDPNQDAF